MNPQANNPLHGITLERMLTELVARFGWDRLGTLIDIRCFQNEPSIKSSLKFWLCHRCLWNRTPCNLSEYTVLLQSGGWR